jgi:hypothetical protein
MIARIPLLTGLLIVQLVLLAVLLLGGDEDRGTAKLLDFEPAQVNALTFEDADGKTVSLRMVDGDWRIGELPADADRIGEVIESLVGGSASWPVATSESSQARFEVAEDAFQRRVRFAGESGELATLYLGSSPGFRRIHAREADADAIFSIDFAVHQLPVDGSDWLDKQLLQTESISRVTFPDGAVLAGNDESGWILDGQAADPEAASRFVERIEGLSVLGLHEASADTVLGEPVTIAVQDDEGSHELSFRFNEAVDEYVLTSDRLPGEFTVASYIVEQILVPTAELLPEAAPESSEAEEDGEAELTPAPAADEG